MIDPLSEDLITLDETAKLVPNRPHRHTVFRWHSRGVRGHKLATVLLVGTRYTTKEALRDFLQAIQQAPGEAPKTAEKSQGNSHQKRVEKMLAS